MISQALQLSFWFYSWYFGTFHVATYSLLVQTNFSVCFCFPSFYTCRNGGSRNVQTQHAFSISFAIWARLKSHTKLYGVGLGLTGFVLLLSSHGMVQWSMYDFDCMLLDGFKIVFLWHPSWAISGWFLLHRLRVQSGLFGCPKFMPSWNGTFHALQRPLSVPFRYIQKYSSSWRNFAEAVVVSSSSSSSTRDNMLGTVVLCFRNCTIGPWPRVGAMLSPPIFAR